MKQNGGKNLYFGDPQVEAEASRVYEDGLNIYQMVSRLKREMGWKASDQFPNEVILRFCQAYWRSKAQVKNTWPYFIRTFKAVSSDYFAERNQAEGEALKKAKVPDAIKEIMKGLFNADA